jgi:outer membrane protein assembly factor BamA
MRAGFLMITLLMLKVTFGQGNHTLQVVAPDKPESFFTKQFSYPKRVKDSAQAKTEARNLFNKLRSSGYPGASVDSMKGDTLHTYIYMYVGEKFANIVLKNGNVDERLIGDAGVKQYLLTGKPVQVEVAEMVKEKLLEQCENTGYPFAVVKLDSFKQTGNFFSASIFLTKNELIRYDTLRILGKTKTKRAFLKNYLNLKPGKPYNEASVKLINQRLANLQFLEPVQKRTVEFINGKSKVLLFLKDKKASQFDAILGLLPGSSGQKVLITGDVNLNLLSPFGMGEDFALQWQKLQPKTQTLDVKVSYPYLLGLPLGINVAFDLFKHDTSYVDINGDYGLQYQLSGSNYIRASLQQKITVITDVDTAYIIQNRTLPPNIDLSSNDFALEFHLENLDYKINPVKGYTLTIDAAAGQRVIKKNPNILQLYDEVSGQYFSYLYDTIKLKTIELKLGLTVEKYWKLAAKHTIKTSFDGKYFYAPTVFQNEMYRLGGISSLRGFDDQSIYTPYYTMGNIEYRYLLSKNSFFGAFFNAALVQNAPDRKGRFDYPFGFGVTAALETKAGVFAITYAMGRQLGNKINFNSAKIHFGYINYF